jgi:hypothetical protein
MFERTQYFKLFDSLHELSFANSIRRLFCLMELEADERLSALTTILNIIAAGQVTTPANRQTLSRKKLFLFTKAWCQRMVVYPAVSRLCHCGEVERMGEFAWQRERCRYRKVATGLRYSTVHARRSLWAPDSLGNCHWPGMFSLHAREYALIFWRRLMLWIAPSFEAFCFTLALVLALRVLDFPTVLN